MPATGTTRAIPTNAGFPSAPASLPLTLPHPSPMPLMPPAPLGAPQELPGTTDEPACPMATPFGSTIYQPGWARTSSGHGQSRRWCPATKRVQPPPAAAARLPVAIIQAILEEGRQLGKGEEGGSVKNVWRWNRQLCAHCFFIARLPKLLTQVSEVKLQGVCTSCPTVSWLFLSPSYVD